MQILSGCLDTAKQLCMECNNISNRQRLLRSVVVASAADEEEFTLVNLHGGKCLWGDLIRSPHKCLWKSPTPALPLPRGCCRLTFLLTWHWRMRRMLVKHLTGKESQGTTSSSFASAAKQVRKFAILQTRKPACFPVQTRQAVAQVPCQNRESLEWLKRGRLQLVAAHSPLVPVRNHKYHGRTQ